MNKYILNNISDETIDILEGYKEVENRTGRIISWSVKSLTEKEIARRYGLDIYSPNYFINLENSIKKNYPGRIPHRLSKWTFSKKINADGKLEVTTSMGWIRIEKFDEE